MGYLGNQITTVFPTSISVDSATISSNASVGGNLSVTGTGIDMVLLHTSTVTSNVGEVQIDGHFTSAFKNYKIIGSNIHCSSDNVHLNLKFMIGGSLATGSVHRSSFISVLSGNDTIFHTREQTDTEFAGALGRKYGGAVGENGNFELILYDPLATNNFKHFHSNAQTSDNATETRVITFWGFYNSGQSALSGVEIVFSSGNISSGVFKLYGLR